MKKILILAGLGLLGFFLFRKWREYQSNEIKQHFAEQKALQQAGFVANLFQLLRTPILSTVGRGSHSGASQNPISGVEVGQPKPGTEFYPIIPGSEQRTVFIDPFEAEQFWPKLFPEPTYTD